MWGERSSFPALTRCWERRTGYWLDDFSGLYDPGQEATRSLYPNDQPEAWLLPATSWQEFGLAAHAPFGVPPLTNRRRVAMSFIGVDLHTTSFHGLPS